MPRVFSPDALAASALKSSLSKISGYNRLYTFSRAPDLLLREVDSMEKAIMCGGVFIAQMSTDGTPVLMWQFVAGEVMRAALKRAGHNGLLDQEGCLYRRRVRWPVRPEGPASGQALKVGAVDVLPLKSGTYTPRIDTTRDYLVMGLITRGHGRGYGPAKLAGTGSPAYDEHVDVPQTMNLADPSNHLDGFNTAWPMTPVAQQYCLSAKVTVAPSIRAFMLKNKAAIIDRWSKLGAPTGAVFDAYVNAYDSAVTQAFAAETPLVMYFPYVGAGEESAGLFGVTSLGVRKYGSGRVPRMLAGENANYTATPADVAKQGHFLWDKYGVGSAAAGIDILGPEGLTPISGLQGSIRVGSVEFSQRELLGSCLPKAGLNFGAQPGSYVADTYIQRLLATRVPDASFAASGELTLEKVDAAEASFSNMVANQLSDTSGYLGPYLGQMMYLGQVWDQVAKDEAKG